MAEIYSSARRFAGTDWDSWAGAQDLPSGDRPAILETDSSTVVLCGGEEDYTSSTVVVALTYEDSNGHFPYYNIIRTVGKPSEIGTVEEIETEQTDLFNKIARALEAGQSPERVAAYYGLEFVDVM